MTCERPWNWELSTSATFEFWCSQVILADRGEGDGRPRQPPEQGRTPSPATPCDLALPVAFGRTNDQ